MFFSKVKKNQISWEDLAKKTLQKALENTLDSAISPLEKLVAVFDLVGPWYDSREEIEDCPMKKHLCLLGRDTYGINRTESGDRVTADKVYLGNIYGYWTFSVDRWLELFGEGTDAQPVIEAQAAEWLVTAQELIDILKDS